MDIEARAAAVGYRLAQRRLHGPLVWWWQRLDEPEDTRQPCWLQRSQALGYMDSLFQRSAFPPTE